MAIYAISSISYTASGLQKPNSKLNFVHSKQQESLQIEPAMTPVARFSHWRANYGEVVL